MEEIAVMSSNPEDPDDTLQRLLSRKKVSQSYSASDVVMLEALNDVRDKQITSRKAKPCPPPAGSRGNRYWFDAR